MIATILARHTPDAGARTAAWRQLVDIVAQAGDALDPDHRAAAHARIADLRPAVSAADRRRAAASLAGRATQPDAVAIFGSDDAAIAAPVLALAVLPDATWLALLPAFPPATRAILRNRRDLSATVERALALYGASDFALPPGAPPGAGDRADSQIRQLVERIEAFRSQVRAEPAATPVAATTGFAFETTADGTIDWIDGTTREALIGLSIADAARPGGFGVDGHAAGAFQRRAPFHDARLLVAGTSAAGGDWRIAAAPIFNPRNGRFAGYHGSARRPRPDELATPPSPGVAGTALPADSLYQLVHELRTPINAIQGFAEMIDRQMLGPVAAAYRARAQLIAGKSTRLLAVVEDLDAAARLDSNRFDVDPGTSDATAVIARVARDLRPSLAARNVTLDTGDGQPCTVNVADGQLDRIVRRLIAATIGVAAPAETLHVASFDDGNALRLTLSRPAALDGRAEATLLDPGYGPEGDWPDAPNLGLGFTLRLVAKLAQANGGALSIGDHSFVLTLPRAGERHESQGGQG